jgi:predicted membrane protein
MISTGIVERKKAMKSNNNFFFGPRLVLGLGVIAIGVLFFLDNMHIVEAETFLRYWPVIFIIVGISHFFQHRTIGGTTWSLVLIFIGTGMLLDRMYDIEFNIWSFWPVLLVFFGASMIAQSMRYKHIEIDEENLNDDTMIKTTALMGGVKRNISTKNFQGGELTAIMGGIDIDLREAGIEQEAVIDVLALMGGIEIKVPEDWRVIVHGFPFMGGFVNNTRAPKDENAKRLIIKGTAVMGGVDIRNTGESSYWDHHHAERERRRDEMRS